jgi:hypothetical protein
MSGCVCSEIDPDLYLDGKGWAAAGFTDTLLSGR